MTQLSLWNVPARSRLSENQTGIVETNSGAIEVGDVSSPGARTIEIAMANLRARAVSFMNATAKSSRPSPLRKMKKVKQDKQRGRCG